MTGVLFKSLMGGGTKYLIAIALICASAFFVYDKGRSDQALECRAAELTLQLEQLKADRDRLEQQVANAEKVRKQMSTQLLADIEALTLANIQAKEFANDVKSRDNLCPPVSANDASRLLNIQ